MQREDVLTTSEAVRLFGMHPATVLRLILTGQVAAHKNPDGRWLIRRVDLARWSARRARRALGLSRDPEPGVTE